MLLTAAAVLALAAPPALELDQLATGLEQPTSVTHLGSRVLVTEKTGKVKQVRPDGTFGSWGRLPVSSDGERGLLSIAPTGNRRYYAAFTDSKGALVVSRVRKGELQRILRVPHPEYANHNGGQLALFRGLLYISTGDGGGSGDPFGAAGNLRDLRGKILRIDPTCPRRYCIPRTNPRRSPVIAYGLRNPWRFSIDPPTQRLWIGDVGQNAWEEVDRMRIDGPLVDFGWSCWEGPVKYNADRCRGRRVTKPVLSYGHSEGESVTGGYVYRGKSMPGLRGWYVFGDFISGTIWGFRDGRRVELGSAPGLTSFGTDRNGELLAVTIDGGVYRLVPAKT